LIDALDIALRAREIDMRASPYDLKAYTGPKPSQQFSKIADKQGLGTQFNTTPIFVETPEVIISLHLKSLMHLGKKRVPKITRRNLSEINFDS
jgi:hypothetical protein